MWDAWLRPTNVVHIARQLLQMKQADFEKVNQQTVTDQLIQLDVALCQYLFPPQPQGYRYKYSPIEEAEQHLRILMLYTQQVFSCLTPEKQDALRAALATRRAIVHDYCEV